MKVSNLITLLFVVVLLGCKSSILDDPSLDINYSVPEKSLVKLTVENSYNTKIFTLVNKEQNAGVYEINFNVSDLPEGVYFYTIELKGINSSFYLKTTKQLLLVK